MNCPNCRNETQEPLTCNQCGSTFCPPCQPYYDTEGDVCQGCQEQNSIAAIKDNSWTEKLRRWFHKAAPIPEPTTIVHPPPWGVNRNGDKWDMYSLEDMTIVAVFDDLATAEYACDAANSYFELSMAAAITYNRIRAGDPFFTGSRRDCDLWTRVRNLLK